LAQVPLVGAPALMLQASQSPLHEVLQHTPLAQKLLVHSCPPVGHAAPTGFVATQAPAEQKFPGAQSGSNRQLDVHAVAPQM
jgi:hypothetical protein